MPISIKCVRVRFCEDTWFGRAGTQATVPLEYAEAMFLDKKCVIISDKSLTNRASMMIKTITPPRGGLDGDAKNGG